MTDQSPSGNRWEPAQGAADGADTAPITPLSDDHQPPHQSPSRPLPAPAVEPVPVAEGLSPHRTPARAAVAGAAVALFLVAGAGGYAAARLTGSDGGTGRQVPDVAPQHQVPGVPDGLDGAPGRGVPGDRDRGTGPDEHHPQPGQLPAPGGDDAGGDDT